MWIFHVDMNSFFASVEQQLNPRLRDKAIGVGGKPGTRSIIAAASYPAKKQGVKIGMSSEQALRVCPSLIIVKPHYRLYQTYSRKIFTILESFTPDMEIFSIDEAFLKIDVENLDQIIEITTAIRKQFRQELGECLTASIGIASSKKLAKLASDLQKPDGLVFILEDSELDTYQYLLKSNIRVFLRTDLYRRLPVETICGIGEKLAWRLNSYGIYTLADLASKSFAKIKTIAFPYHQELYLISRGRDLNIVRPHWQHKEEKSIGHQYTLPKDIPLAQLKPFVAYLAEKVGQRMRKSGFIAHKINLWLRLADRSNWHDSITVNNAIKNDRHILKLAWQLIEKAIGDHDCGLKLSTLIRMPSLTVTNLKKESRSTLSIWVDDKDQALSRAIDKIKNRFGLHSISNAWSHNLHLLAVVDGRRKNF